jgi:hypothetical protein
LVLVTLVLLLSSCSERSEYGKKSDYEKLGANTTETEGGTDTTVPKISSVSPTDNSTNNSPDTTIAVTFSEAMSTGTISTNTADTSCSGNFQLSANSFTSCIKMTTAPTASNSGKTFTATPSDNLSGLTSYKLKITTSVNNTSSNSLASAYISDGFFTAPSGSGIIKGRIIKQSDSSVLSDVTVNYAVSGKTFANTTSDSNGDYIKSSLNNGAYTLSYSKDGYLDAIQSATIATTNQTLVAASQTMISTSCTGGDISGIIKDAVTGNAIQGVSISIRSGLNVRSGDTISGKTDTTDSNGAYTLSSMNPGSYTIQGSKDNWISTYFNVRSCTGASGINSNLSEQLAAGAMRIVLSWVGGEDFDSHLEIPCTSGTCDGSDADDKSHLWYSVNQGGVSTNDYHNYTDIVNPGDNVTLDQDNTDGSASPCGSTCGPETITISKIRSGTYRYHVYAYDQSSSTSSRHIADNGTVVQVFYNNSSTNFDVPSTVGNLWTVFDFDIDNSSVFNTLNTMSNEDSDDDIDDH